MNYNFPDKLPISATIITYNEERDIERLLKSLDFIEEIIIVDSYSTDKTVEIAKKYTNKIYFREFDNYSNQRNYTVSFVTQPWILKIDGDECLTDKLKHKLYDIFNNDNPNIRTCYRLRHDLIFMGKKLKFGRSHKYVPHLFNFNDLTYGGAVHERIDFTGVRTIKLNKPRVNHYHFKNITHSIQKANSYSTLRAQDFVNKNKTIRWYHIAIYPAWRFFFHYIFHLGFLDGLPGLFFAKVKTLEVYLRNAKCKEIMDNKSNNR